MELLRPSGVFHTVSLCDGLSVCIGQSLCRSPHRHAYGVDTQLYAVQSGGKDYHRRCFTCWDCNRPFVINDTASVRGRQSPR